MARNDDQALRYRARVRVALAEIAPLVSQWIRRYPGVPDGTIQVGEMLATAGVAIDKGRDPVAAAVAVLRPKAFLADVSDDEITVAVRRALEAADAEPEPTEDDCVRDDVVAVPQHLKGIMSIRAGVMSARPCFTGTRVPIDVLFANLAKHSIVEIIERHYTSVSRRQVDNALIAAGQAMVNEALAPLVGQRRRDRSVESSAVCASTDINGDGNGILDVARSPGVYTVTGVIGDDRDGNGVVRVQYGDGSLCERLVGDVLRDPLIRDDDHEIEALNVDVPRPWVKLVEVGAQWLGGVPRVIGTRVPVISTVIGNLLDGMTLAEIAEHYPSVPLDALKRLALQAGDALCREAFSPLVGQRRRRADGTVYTVTEIVGSDSAGDWSVAVRDGKGETEVMAVADVLEDDVVHTWSES